MAELPISTQQAIWEMSVKKGEAVFLPLRTERPDIPVHRVMLMTTLMVRWMHETIVDTITPLPPTEWETSDPHTEVSLLQMVLATWIEPLLKQAFDATVDTVEPEASYLRASRYEPSLQTSIPDAPERADTIAFLVEVDRRFFQSTKDLPNAPKLCDRLRYVIDQVQREITEAMQNPLEILKRASQPSKGFGKQNPHSNKKDLN